MPGWFSMNSCTSTAVGFWSASDLSSHSTNYRGLGNRKCNAGRYTALKNAGFSPRCLADADSPKRVAHGRQG